MKLRSVFSACSARSSHWCCSCSNFALVTESAAASAAAAHLRANCRRYSVRALIQSNRRGLLQLQGRHCLFRCGAERAACLAHSPRTGITKEGPFSFIVSSHELISMRQTNANSARKSAVSGCRVLQCNIQPCKRKSSRCLRWHGDSAPQIYLEARIGTAWSNGLSDCAMCREGLHAADARRGRHQRKDHRSPRSGPAVPRQQLNRERGQPTASSKSRHRHRPAAKS